MVVHLLIVYVCAGICIISGHAHVGVIVSACVFVHVRECICVSAPVLVHVCQFTCVSANVFECIRVSARG